MYFLHAAPLCSIRAVISSICCSWWAVSSFCTYLYYVASQIVFYSSHWWAWTLCFSTKAGLLKHLSYYYYYY